jgi:hypothetical protein
MHRLTFLAVVVLSAVIVMRQPVAPDPFAEYEQARVRAHFDSAEREVRGHPVAGLSIAQRAARMRALDRVHAYAGRGVFPTNPDFPGKFVPYFVDRITGTRCGMAYLIEQSGSSGLVARIAATNNNASIFDLKDDPELLAWLERNGLTLEEAARIQPKYCGEERPGYPLCNPPSVTPPVSTSYKFGTGALATVDVVAVSINVMGVHGSKTLTGAAAVTSGMLGMVIGVPNLSESGSTQTLGWVNTTVGAASTALGLYWLLQPRTAKSPVSFAPWFSASGASGFSGRMTF